MPRAEHVEQHIESAINALRLAAKLLYLASIMTRADDPRRDPLMDAFFDADSAMKMIETDARFK